MDFILAGIYHRGPFCKKSVQTSSSPCEAANCSVGTSTDGPRPVDPHSTSSTEDNDDDDVVQGNALRVGSLRSQSTRHSQRARTATEEKVDMDQTVTVWVRGVSNWVGALPALVSNDGVCRG